MLWVQQQRINIMYREIYYLYNRQSVGGSGDGSGSGGVDVPHYCCRNEKIYILVTNMISYFFGFMRL